MTKIKEVLTERKMFGTHYIYDGQDFLALVALEENQIDNILEKFGIEKLDTLTIPIEVINTGKSMFDGKTPRESVTTSQNTYR